MELYIADINTIELDRENELSGARAEKYKRLKQIDDKKRCIAGGLFIKKFFPNAIIALNEYGKPYAQDGRFFNLSHSGSYVLFALSDYEVGCDIQEIRRLRAFDRTSSMAFCGSELSRLESAPDKYDEFFKLWTKKEALLKCMGKGFHKNSKSVDVSGDRYVDKDGVTYYLKLFDFSGYTIAVCSVKNDFPDEIKFISL